MRGQALLLSVVLLGAIACTESSIPVANSVPGATGSPGLDAETAKREARGMAAEFGRVTRSHPCRTATMAQVRRLQEATRGPGGPVAVSEPQPPGELRLWVCDVDTVNGRARAVFAADPSAAHIQWVTSGPFADTPLPSD